MRDRLRRLRARLIVAGAVGGSVIAIALPAVQGGGGGDVANLWVTTGTCDTTPTRQASPATFAASTAAAKACTFEQAYIAAAAGDTVRCTAGTYAEAWLVGVTAKSPGVTFIGPTGTPGAGPATRCTVSVWDVDTPNTTWDHIDVDGNGVQTVVAEVRGDADGLTWTNSAIGDNVNVAVMQNTANDATFDNILWHDAIDDGTTGDVHMECAWMADVEGMVIRNSEFRNCSIFDIAFTWGDWWDPDPPGYNNILIENTIFGCSRATNGTGYHVGGASVRIGGTGPSGPNTVNDDYPLDNWDFRYNTICNISLAGTGSRTMPNSEWVGNVGMLACRPNATYRYNVGDTCSGANSVSVSPTTVSGVPVFRTPFVDEPNYDFRLHGTSPGIGAGDPTDYPLTDRLGVARGNPPDAGALEVVP